MTEQTPLALKGGIPCKWDPLDPDALIAKWRRLVEFERYLVCVNTIEDGQETMQVLAGYFYTFKDAMDAWLARLAEHPGCAIVTTKSLVDPEDVSHAEQFAHLIRRAAGLQGAGIQ